MLEPDNIHTRRREFSNELIAVQGNGQLSRTMLMRLGVTLLCIMIVVMVAMGSREAGRRDKASPDSRNNRTRIVFWTPVNAPLL